MQPSPTQFLPPEWFTQQATGAGQYLMSVIVPMFQAFMPLILFIIGVGVALKLINMVTGR